MSRIIIDASIAMAWCFEDEEDPLADQAMAHLRTGEAIVPSLWPLEVANTLLVGERRKRIQPQDITRFVQILSNLRIQIAPPYSLREMDGLLEIGRRHGLSSYDAAYLQLAIEQAVPLATLDKPLRNAAGSAGVTLL